MKDNTLILISASYPYGYSETFLENEIPYISKSFEKIIIISNDTTSTTKRATPINVEIIRFPYLPNTTQKIKSIRNIFDPLFWKEMHCVRNQYKLTITRPIISTALASIEKGRELKKLINAIIGRQSLNADKLTLYSYWNNDMALGLAFLKDDLNNKIFCVSRAHGWDVYHERSQINYLPFRDKIFTTLDKVCFISNQGLTYTINRMGKSYPSFSLNKLGTKGNGILNPLIKKDAFTIVSCSNIIELKRLDLIIQALSLVPPGMRFHWIHIGTGPKFSDIKFLADQLLLKKSNTSFEFLGQLSNSQILSIYDQKPIDLFINVSSSEGIPVSIMEAMSKGIVVLATDVGGTGEIVNDENGFLISRDITPEKLALKLTQIYNTDSLQINKKREKAFASWQLNYNADINFPKFIEQLSNGKKQSN